MDNQKPEMRPIVIDGMIYVAVAMLGMITPALCTEDARAHINDNVLFYAKNTSAALTAGLLGLKMFRSRAYAEYKDAKLKTNQNGSLTNS